MSKNFVQRMRRNRVYLLLAAHLMIFVLVYEVAFQLRFEFSVLGENRTLLWETLPWAVAIKAATFFWIGSFRGWWRYVTFADLASLLRAATLATLIIAGIDYVFIEQYQIPRSVLLLDWGLTVLVIGGLRSARRLAREHVRPIFTTDGRRPALMIGADHGGDALVRQIHDNPRLQHRVIGFLDDDESRHGLSFGGIPFLGSPEEAVALAERYKVRDVLVVAHAVWGRRLRLLMEQCRTAGLNLKMIPPVDELLNGSYRFQTRDVNINDLLRREPVQLDTEAIGGMLSGRRVMVTGAGGSIGSEICRQIVEHSPECLILVERAENNLFHIEQELKRLVADVSFVPCIADVGDQQRMRRIFRQHRPQIVFHAAAHKHVPLMEHNPGESLKNNVLATKGLADLADHYSVGRFVMISTDKAVNPVSVMGLSKQLAERYVHACSERSATKFVVVRFGNVLGSNGSVVPIFQEQIRRGGPVTITHPEMERFFMTIREASQLVLQAAAMGRGGEIYVLDMGELIKIVDLAKDLIRLSGLSPEEIEITMIGPRPGEKLFEEVYLDEENTLPTPHPKLRVAYHRFYSLTEVRALIREVAELVNKPDDVIHKRLWKLVGEREHASKEPTRGNGRTVSSRAR